MTEEPSDSAYPCPVCGAQATLAGPCPGCGRAPDRHAAAVLLLHAQIRELEPRVEQAQRSFHDLNGQLLELRRQHTAQAAAVRSSLLAEQIARSYATNPATAGSPVPTQPANAALLTPVTGQQVGWPAAPPRPAPRAPETSTRTVQNLLFILGGLLLGTAAIVFMVVAWATYGVVVKALILVLLTTSALAVPALARRRGLVATAETFAALGLLLLLLDGWAAWYVNFLNVATIAGPIYTAAVATVTAIFGYGYARAIGVTGPRFAALILIQPVLPLAASEFSLEVAGWALVFAAVAAIDLLVLWLLRAAPVPEPDTAARLDEAAVVDTAAKLDTAALGETAPAQPTVTLDTPTVSVPSPTVPSSGPSAPVLVGLRVLSWIAFGGALLIGGAIAAIGWLVADALGEAALGSLAVLVVALLVAAAAALTRSGELRIVAGVALPLAAAAAALRPAVVQWPERWLLWTVGIAAVTVLVTTLLTRRRPGSWATGARVGAALTLLVPALVALGWAIARAFESMGAALPPWHATPEPYSGGYSWELPAVVALVIAAGWIATSQPSESRDRPFSVLRWLIVGVGLLTLAMVLPGHPALTPWAPLAVDLTFAAILLAVALTSVSRIRVITGAAGAGLLGSHALIVGWGTPGRSAAAMAGVIALGIVAAAVALRSEDVRATVGRCGAVIAAALTPPLVAAVAVTFGAGSVLAARAVLAAVLLSPLVIVLAPQRYRPVLAVTVALVGWYPLIMILPHPAAGESAPLYAACGAVAAATAVLLVRASLLAQLGALVAVPILGGLLAMHSSLRYVLLGPATWLDAVWTGAPDGVGLAANRAVAVPYTDVVAFVLLALAGLGVCFAVWGRVVLFGIGPVLAVYIPLALAAIGAPWPAGPAACLLIGLFLLAYSALRGLPTPALNLLWLLAGCWATLAGLAGSLAREWSTITGLALLVVTMAVPAFAGRHSATRVAGWLVGGVAKVLLAVAIGQAAALSGQYTAYLVLLAAGILLAAAGSPIGTPARAAAEAAAHSAALVALALCEGRPQPSAVVLAIWGVAIGLTVLREPDPARRVGRVVVALAAESAAWWLLLWSRDVEMIEAYTLPPALVGLAVGSFALRRRAELSSWKAVGAALGAALLPSLALVLDGGADSSRRLLLGAGALAVVIVGSVTRLRAPAVLGGLTLVLLALREIVYLSQRVEFWIPLAVGGILLVLLAITYERRRRDVKKLVSALGRMR